MLSSSARASGADDGDATVSTHAPRATVARRASRRDRRERTIARIVVEISNSPILQDGARASSPRSFVRVRRARPRTSTPRGAARRLGWIRRVRRDRGRARVGRARGRACGGVPSRAARGLTRTASKKRWRACRRSRLDRGGGRARRFDSRRFPSIRRREGFFDRRAPRDSARNFIRARARGSVDGIYRYEVSYYKDSVAEWSKAPD